MVLINFFEEIDTFMNVSYRSFQTIKQNSSKYFHIFLGQLDREIVHTGKKC